MTSGLDVRTVSTMTATALAVADMIGMARSENGDHSGLFNWFRFWHHRIGKCDTPNCVAQV